MEPSAKNEDPRPRTHVLLLLAVPAGAAPTAQTKKSATDPAQQAEIAALVTAVDDLMGGKSVAPSLPVKWEQEHFLKAEAGKTYMPVHARHRSARSGAVRPGRRLRSRGEEGERAVPTAPPRATKQDKDAPPPSPYAFDQIVFVNPEPVSAGQPQRIRRALAVEPGDYEIYVVVRGTAAPVAAASTPTTAAPPAARQRRGRSRQASCRVPSSAS